jgi:hypothetical protein
MSNSYDEAVEALYRAPQPAFVTERQRLANQLKSDGDKAGAAALAKLSRPSISAWAVNQLWWHARKTFEELFETAAQLRNGKLDARSAHRRTVAQLSTRARQLLSEAGHAASESTVRRVEMTLSSLAASGGFDPEPPGALSQDREPAGFEAFGMASFPESAGPPAPPAREQPAPKHMKGTHQSSDAHELADSRERAAAEKAEAEREREAAAKAKKLAAKQESKGQVRVAKHTLAECEQAQKIAAKALATAEKAVEHARSQVAHAEAHLASLDDD